jgi:hypothetical protein
MVMLFCSLFSCVKERGRGEKVEENLQKTITQKTKHKSFSFCIQRARIHKICIKTSALFSHFIFSLQQHQLDDVSCTKAGIERR